MINVRDDKISQTSATLLSDCYLTIDFNSIPFSVSLVFISNIERKKVIVICHNISKFKLEKDADEYPFYTVLETKIEKVNSDWIINILPEIDVNIICENITMTIEDLSDKQLSEYGLV
ncbi:MAG: hypothetical protein PVI97_12755 [Candidatus Thiodiazotropha sp.]|jgi:hypothetical protein